MSLYWAKFKRHESGRIFRFETRVYLSDIPKCTSTDPVIGAVIAKNPGSAQPSAGAPRTIQPIQLANDRLLPTVRSIVRKAYRGAKTDAPQRGYIQVLNLFYLCDNDFKHAIREISRIDNPPIDPAESKRFPWVFYLWGDYTHNKAQFIQRFTDLDARHHFYFDKNDTIVVPGVPVEKSFAKHTQGLNQKPIIEHMADFLSLL